MANPLEMGSPPPPHPDGNALQVEGGGGAPANAPAPPTHAQTVAALRHFDAIKNELMTLMKIPNFGKTDIKSQVIDGMTKLVSERIMPATQAVIQLSQLPTDPAQQKKWVQTTLAQAQQAEQAILVHHAQGFAGQGPQPAPSRDDHMETMSGLHAQYGGR
jgi:hypothetical protein